jgi:hypothetical protein
MHLAAVVYYLLVPTLGVGTDVRTLCVLSGAGRDAERRHVRSHAERGNEKGSRNHVRLLRASPPGARRETLSAH